MMNIGLIYLGEEDYKTALKFFNDSYQVAKGQESKYLLFYVLFNLSSAYYFIEDFVNAKVYTDHCKKLALDLNIEVEILVIEMIEAALDYQKSGDLPTLTGNYKKITQRLEELNEFEDQVFICDWFCKVLIRQKEYNLLIELIGEIYPKLIETDMVRRTVRMTEFLEVAYSEIGDYESAYKISKERAKMLGGTSLRNGAVQDSFMDNYQNFEKDMYVDKLENTVKLLP